MSSRAVFYYDFNSPFTYLAAERIDGLIPDAKWRPFAFPYLLYELGRLEEALGRDPAIALRDAGPRAAERGLPPLASPPDWPNRTWSLRPLRVAVFAGAEGLLREFSLAALRKVFVEGLPLTDDRNLRDAALAAGLDADAAIGAAERADVKQRLKEHGEEVLALGVAGIPTVAVGGELFWGDDRLEEAAARR